MENRFVCRMDAQGLTGYLAPEEHLADMLAELAGKPEVHGRLALAAGPARPIAWAANIWHEPRRIPITSIAEGARALRAIQRNWSLYACGLHRRASLIAARLPHVGAKPLRFPAPAPAAPLGSWTLLDANTILASPHCASPFPNGEVHFVEDREGPPNRAYLKLWEALTLAGRQPGPGSLCLDLGSSPGGWSWVLQKLGARVISIDKAPLDPKIAALPGIDYRRASAFSLAPGDIGPVDWLFSDVICYPARLLRLVESWLASGLARNFVCTLKFQGETDMQTARRFADIPGSRLVHLWHNKHELTWIRLG
jgi:23S rRNA (cytidine2498-2'-O)-methyltransferase